MRKRLSSWQMAQSSMLGTEFMVRTCPLPGAGSSCIARGAHLSLGEALASPRRAATPPWFMYDFVEVPRGFDDGVFSLQPLGPGDIDDDYEVSTSCAREHIRGK